MITQQYPVLKYTTYFTIFVFHITILFLLYNYSIKSSLSHLALGDTKIHNLNKQLIPIDIQTESEPQNEITKDLPNILHKQHLPNLTSEKFPNLPFFYSPELCLPSQSKQQIVTPQPKAESKEQPISAKPLERSTSKANLVKNVPIIKQTKHVPRIKNQKNLLKIQTKVDNNIARKQAQNTSITNPEKQPALSKENATSRNEETNNKLNIPPSAFFQAFKNSYYQEQALLESTPRVERSFTNSTTDLESESLIKERLGELKIADYIQQIKKAFYEAARRTPGMYLTSGKELKTDLDVKLEIQSQGSVKVVKLQSSGMNEIDDYIKRFLNDIKVKPIPKSYKVSALPFSTKILINVDKNTRFYTVRCFF